MAEELNASGGDLSGEPTGQGGEGNEAGSTDYAGFESIEDLTEAYQGATAQQETLQKQIADLERIKGTQGNELGQLRTQVSELQGQIKGFQTAMDSHQAAQNTVTADDIAQRVEDGEITYADGIRQLAKLNDQRVEKDNKALKGQLDHLIKQNEQNQYIQKFMSENPGFQEAHASGKLDPWLQKGMSGEEAWDKFQIQARDEEIATLKKQAETNKKAGEEAGLDKGMKLEQSKKAAGKVLSGKGGAMKQASPNANLSNPNDRRAAGIELLQKMRSGAG